MVIVAIYLSMVKKLLILKPKILKLYQLKHFKRFFLIEYTKTGLNGYIYDFSVDYWVIANDKIHDIHNYLMKENNIV